MENYNKLIHFFGEMDLDISKFKDEIYKKAFNISECCGYFVENYPLYLVLNGTGGEKFILSFNKKGKLINIIDRSYGKDHYYTNKEIPKYPGYKGGFY